MTTGLQLVAHGKRKRAAARAAMRASDSLASHERHTDADGRTNTTVTTPYWGSFMELMHIRSAYRTYLALRGYYSNTLLPTEQACRC